MSNSIHKMSLRDALNLFKKIPLMIEEFEETRTFIYGEGDTTSKISPLLHEGMMNTAFPSAVVQVALTVIPYYSFTSSNYSETRDIAELDVPRVMRNDFWASLFRDAIGTEANSLLNNIHNKLRYGYLSEEHVLNRGLFKRLLTVSEEVEGEQYSDVSFILQEEKGHLETLDTIIEGKLSSSYKLLNYSPPQSSLIDDWMDSLFLSGQIDYQTRLREENLFKIQDLKSELIRRKFAGSISLYKILASSINRRGTFSPVLPLFSVVESLTFSDNRYIRALDMPGITTITGTSDIEPLKVYGDLMPPRILYPLYYTSADYDAEDFENDPKKFLRNNRPVFAWDNLRGIIDSTLVMKTYPRFDSPGAGSTGFTTLEDDPMLFLDDATSMYDLSAVVGSFFDLQADQVLYHRNSLQGAMGKDYPFVTYTISGNNSLSMMDFPWLDFIDAALDKKTRVQEVVDIGVQISKLAVDDGTIVTENYTVITFSETLIKDFESQDAHFKPQHRYAYLWNLGVKYDAATFRSTTTTKLITYMLLKLDIPEEVLHSDKVELASAHPSFNLFTQYTTGLIPFSYQDLSQSQLLEMKISLEIGDDGNYHIQDDLYEEEYNKAYFLFTSHENVAISKNYIRSNPAQLADADEEGNYIWSTAPVSDNSLKHIIFGVSREGEDPKVTDYFWSEPIRVYPKELAEGFNNSTFYPDWYGLVAYFNPYLNARTDCASPLRGHKTAFRGLRPQTTNNSEEPESEIVPLTGPSLKTALMNINVSRGHTVYSSQTGDGSSSKGVYLHREVTPKNIFDPTFSREAYLLEETLQIWGDNRPIWGDDIYVLDPADDWDNNKVRSQWAQDETGLYALVFKAGKAYEPGVQHSTYLDLRPQKDDSPESTAVWNSWVFNEASSGFTACIDFLLFETPENKAAENYYLLSRHGKDAHQIDRAQYHAEFDFYIERVDELGEEKNPSLVMKVYPEGSLDGLVFDCVLQEEGLIRKNQQSQIACSYLHEEGEETAEGFSTLNITQTVVADRSWKSVYRVVVKDTDAGEYFVYEVDDEEFIITEDSIFSIPIEGSNPYASDTDYFFGHLIKDKGDANNSLEGINLFGRDYGYNVPLGNLYDFRLYNRGMKELETVMVSAGTRKELYSYSPSIYKLAYQQGTDLGILRRHLPFLPEDKMISTVRVFSRGVWDSILSDMHPVSLEETYSDSLFYEPDYRDPKTDQDIYKKTGEDTYTIKEGVIEQTLVPHYETKYDVVFEGGQEIYYKNSKVEGLSSNNHSFVQTSLYPIEYKNDLFRSGLVLKKEEDLSNSTKIIYKSYQGPSNQTLPAGAELASLPSSPSGESLVYKADIDLNFELTSNIDFGSPFVKGPKVVTSLRGDKMALTHSSGPNTKTTTENMVIVPFYVPDQTVAKQSSGFGWEPDLYKLDLQGVTLASSLRRLLNATSYYNEVQTPIPYLSDEGTYKYTSRWHAIRALKEGEYYITCKYPLQILPFDNITASASSRYPVLYASVRFKIVVSGTPKHYEENIVGLPGKWMQSSIEKALETSSYVSEDNRNFPHREMNIDLYALKDQPTSSEWLWDKVASNNEEEEGVVLLDLEALSNNLILDKKVSAFFTTTYLTPFFDKEGNVDLSPVRVDFREEKLTTTSYVEGTPLITVRSGASYRMLFDYTAALTELKYNPIVQLPSPAGFVTPEELDSYNYCVDLMTQGNEYARSFDDISYFSSWNWSEERLDYDLSTKTTGFYVNELGNFAEINQDYNENNLSLGDPYRLSTDYNLLLSKFESQRRQINNLGILPYRAEKLGVITISPSPFGPSPLEPLPVLTKLGGNLMVMPPTRPIDEHAILARHHNNALNTAKNAFSQLKTHQGGVFESLSLATPVSRGVGNYSNEEGLGAHTHEFVSYKVANSVINTLSGIRISRELPLGPNKVVSQNFSDANVYDAVGGYFEYDASLDKDVWSLNAGDSNEFSINYTGALPVRGTSRVRVKSSGSVKVFLRYKEQKTGTEIETASQPLPSDVWTYLTFKSDLNKSASRVSIVFVPENGSNLAGEEIRIDGFEVRQSTTNSYEMGISESLVGGSRIMGATSLSIPGFTSIAFKNKATKGYFPIQVFNSPASVSREDSVSRISSFADNNQKFVRTTEDEVPLFKPWKKRLSFSQRNPEATALYPFNYLNVEGNKRSEVVSSNAITKGIFEIKPDSITFTPPRYIEFAGEEGLIYFPDRFKEEYKFALNISASTPFSFNNERFSMVSNCFNYEKFKRGVSSPVAVTNIQFLNNADPPSILYELEYFPIIYDELRHHLSLNLLLRE